MANLRAVEGLLEYVRLADMRFDGVLSNCVLALEDRAEDCARFMSSETKRYVEQYWKSEPT